MIDDFSPAVSGALGVAIFASMSYYKRMRLHASHQELSVAPLAIGVTLALLYGLANNALGDVASVASAVAEGLAGAFAASALYSLDKSAQDARFVAQAVAVEDLAREPAPHAVVITPDPEVVVPDVVPARPTSEA